MKLRQSRGEGMLGGPETASRADSGGRDDHQEASRRQPVAVSSGDTPSLFAVEPSGPRSHYEEED